MKRTKTQRGRDRRLIASLYLKGEYQADIAAVVGISQSAVSKELTKLQDDWRASSLIDINEAKARELAKIDTLELEYWSAWKRSQEDAEVENLEQIGKPQQVKDPHTGATVEQIVNAHLKKSTRREGQSGNPAFLRGVEWCINKRCEIIGINAPVKQELTGKGGEPLIPKGDNELRSEILRKLDSIATATGAGAIPIQPDGE